MTCSINKPLIIAPSLLACDFSNPAPQVIEAEKGGAEYLHLDVMDGIFVPNISFGPCVISSLRKISNMIFDVHLMICDPIRYIDDYRKAGADIITIHAESCNNCAEVLKYIRSLGIKASVSIKPGTEVDSIIDLLPICDMVLVMSVEPGFGGQKFMPISIEKIKKLKSLREQLGYDYDIEVDGGISKENIALVTSAGANVIVAGSSVFGAENIENAVKELKEAAV